VTPPQVLLGPDIGAGERARGSLVASAAFRYIPLLTVLYTRRCLGRGRCGCGSSRTSRRRWWGPRARARARRPRPTLPSAGTLPSTHPATLPWILRLKRKPRQRQRLLTRPLGSAALWHHPCASSAVCRASSAVCHALGRSACMLFRFRYIAPLSHPPPLHILIKPLQPFPVYPFPTNRSSPFVFFRPQCADQLGRPSSNLHADMGEAELPKRDGPCLLDGFHECRLGSVCRQTHLSSEEDRGGGGSSSSAGGGRRWSAAAFEICSWGRRIPRREGALLQGCKCGGGQATETCNPRRRAWHSN
jgi:hypothetical protein